MKSSQFKLLITMIVLSISTLVLILIPTVQFARNALKQQATDKMALSLEVIQTDLEKNIEEAEKIVSKLKMFSEDYFKVIEPKTYSDYKLFIDAIEPSIKLEAQNHKQSRTAYIYIDPELFDKPLDVYYADQNGTGQVSKQNSIPIEYFVEGPTQEDDKAWWFGPIENKGTFWTEPYDWIMDNGTVLRFMSHTMPIYYKDKFIAVVGTDIDYSYLTDKIRSFKILETGYAFLLDSHSNEIYYPSFIDDSEDRISVTKEISNGWVVGISVLESEIYSDIAAFNNELIISVLMTLMLASIIALLFSKSISRPILTLVHAIERSKEDKLFVELPEGLLTRSDEIGILTRAINQYSETLLKTTGQLSLFEQSLDHGESGFVMLDQTYQVIYANKTFLSLTHHSNLIMENLETYGIHITDDQKAQLDVFNELKIESYLKTNNNQMIPIKIYLSKFNSELAYCFGILKDLTQIRLNELQFNEAKYYDPLTHLFNRHHFLDTTNQILEVLPQTEFICLLINVDNFRLLNGILGTELCNALLKEVANRLKANISNDAIIGRTDGDEFSVLLPATEIDTQMMMQYLHQLKARLSEPIFKDEEQIFITLSMGYAVYPQDGTNIYQIQKKSNIALTQAKAYGKNQLIKYENSVEENGDQKQEFYKALRFAIKNNELYLVFQPQMDVTSLKVVGIEVLLRWLNNGVLISPAEFIPIAEQSRLIIPIGAFVLEKSFEFAHEFHKKHSEIEISINLSVEQLRFDIVVKQVEKLLQVYPIDPSKVVFEVTESLLVTSTDEAVLVIKTLKNMGFHIALDDFGMGYSSLSYLKTLPFDIIKIDRAFIKDYPERDNGSIAALIVHLGKDLNVKIIAEGVETIVQSDYLASIGCTCIQGFYYSKPLEATDLIKYLNDKS